MKLICLILLVIAPAFNVQAGSCGVGKITRILVGGYNSDDLISNNYKGANMKKILL